jgi:hypothetical protein
MPTRAEVEAWHKANDDYDSDDTIRGPSVQRSEGLTKSSSPPLKGHPAKEIEDDDNDSPYKSGDEVGLGLSFYHNGKKSTEFFPSSPEQKRKDKGKAVAAIDERVLREPEPPALDPDSREKAKVVEARILANRPAHLTPAPWLNTKPTPAKPTRTLKPFAPLYGNCATLNPLKPRALQRIMADRFEHSPRPQTPSSSSPRPRLLIYDGDFSSPPEELLNRLLTENLRNQAESLSSRSCSGSSGKRSAFIGTPNPSARSTSDPVSGNPIGSLRLPSSGSAAAPAARNANANTNANATAATVETPTHQGQPLTARNLAALRATHYSPQSPSIIRSAPLRSLSGPYGIAFWPYCDQEGRGPLSPATFGQRVFSFPINASREEILAISQSPSVAIPSEARGPFYFTEAEREALDDVAEANLGDCPGHHRNCTACIDTEHAYNELRVMPATMSLEERQRIINDNRSLRNIKNVSFTRPPFFPMLTESRSLRVSLRMALLAMKFTILS